MEECAYSVPSPIPAPVEFLHSLNPPSLPPSELKLKVGCHFILLQNIAPAQGLCNGTRMTVCKMADRVLEVQLIGGDHHSKIAFIPRISFSPVDSSDIAVDFSRCRFPVCLAFAMSINKASLSNMLELICVFQSLRMGSYMWHFLELHPEQGEGFVARLTL
jgi:hypothetical protein